MKGVVIFLILALSYSQILASEPKKVSEDCLWGRTDAATCCKDIPEGDSTHLANPKECGSFYLCKNRLPMLWPCLPGQIYSVANQKCEASSTPNQCDQLVFRRLATKKVSDDCLWGRTDAATCCKDIPEGDSTHLANPKECGSFYLCKNRLPMLWPCLPGQIYSVANQKCEASSTPNKCDQVVFRRLATKKVSDDCLWGRTDAATCCKDIPEGDPTHLANPKECGSFYLCKNRLPMLWPCLPGQIYSVANQKCEASSTPNQCDQVVFRRLATKKVSDDCLWGRTDAATCCKDIPEGDSTHLANPKECGSFYLCKNRLPMLWPCLPGQIYSVANQKCEASSTPNQCDQVVFRRLAAKKVSDDCLWGRTDAATCCKDIPEGDSTHLANPKECGSFYLCKNRLPMLWPCLPGQIYSVANQKCEASSTPNQCDQAAFLRFVTKKVSDDCLWGRTDAATCCKDIPQGDSTHLANPKECSSFYLCKNSLPMLWPCLPGQVWSVENQLCQASDDTNTCPQKQ